MGDRLERERRMSAHLRPLILCQMGKPTALNERTAALSYKTTEVKEITTR